MKVQSAIEQDTVEQNQKFGSISIAKYGPMTLLNTKSISFYDAQSSVEKIFNELFLKITPNLYNKNKGISAFIQCVMADDKKRIKKTSLEAMN